MPVLEEFRVKGDANVGSAFGCRCVSKADIRFCTHQIAVTCISCIDDQHRSLGSGASSAVDPVLLECTTDEFEAPPCPVFEFVERAGVVAGHITERKDDDGVAEVVYAGVAAGVGQQGPERRWRWRDVCMQSAF